MPPQIPGSRLHNSLSVNVGSPLRILCEASGSPEPTIEWHQNADKIDPIEARHIRILQNGRMLLMVAAKVNVLRIICIHDIKETTCLFEMEFI